MTSNLIFCLGSTICLYEFLDLCLHDLQWNTVSSFFNLLNICSNSFSLGILLKKGKLLFIVWHTRSVETWNLPGISIEITDSIDMFLLLKFRFECAPTDTHTHTYHRQLHLTRVLLSILGFSSPVWANCYVFSGVLDNGHIIY